MTSLVRWGASGSWPLGAVRLGLVMVALGLLASLPGVLLSPPVGTGTRTFDPTSLADVAGLVAFAPLVETAILAGLHRALRPRLSAAAFAWAAALLFALAHFNMYTLPVAQLISFLLMSYQYIIFRERFGMGRAYFAVTLTHAVNNAAGLMIVALGQWV